MVIMGSVQKPKRRRKSAKNGERRRKTAIYGERRNTYKKYTHIPVRWLWSLTPGIYSALRPIGIPPGRHCAQPRSAFSPYWAFFTGRHSAGRHSGTHPDLVASVAATSPAQPKLLML